MGPRLAYALELPPELAQQQVPTLLLQPLVENSIQHGLEPKVEGGRITVSARRDGAVLTLRVEDSGTGSADASAKGSGFGLTQVRERLATLYGTAAALDFTSDAGKGACATTRIPLTP
jgi:sensor histidine kinase YesM